MGLTIEEAIDVVVEACMNDREKKLRDALVSLGWTPPTAIRKNVNAFPEEVQEALKENGYKDDDFLHVDNAFDQWCDYEGLVNYGPTIRRLISACKTA